jgi:GMP synthase (glutamine-hydrolysing)
VSESPSTQPESTHLADRPVLVVDFGAQYAQLIARRVREANCFSEVVPHTRCRWPRCWPRTRPRDPLRRAVVGLRGRRTEPGPGAARRPGCRSSACATASRRWSRRSAARWSAPGLSEFGATPATILDTTSTLFNGQPVEQSVWMSHGDSVTGRPGGDDGDGHDARARPSRPSRTTSVASTGVQWHPEVLHSTFGQQVLENFLLRGAGLTGDWTAGPTSSTSSSRRCASRSVTRGHLRPVRWGRLLGGRGARAARPSATS